MVLQAFQTSLLSLVFDNRMSNTVGVLVHGSDRNYALFMRPDVILQFGELRIFFALIVLFTIVISILLFLISTTYLVKPITRLSDATKRIAQGNYKSKLLINRRDEIGQLAEHFMTMSHELTESIKHVNNLYPTSHMKFNHH